MDQTQKIDRVEVYEHCPATSGIKIAYIMSRFPKLSETFVLYEMLALEQLGLGVEIFPLIDGHTAVMHNEATDYIKRAHYTPFFSAAVLKAQIHYINTMPRAYLRLWRDIVRGMRGQPKSLLRAMLLLPKAIYFARWMSALQISHIHAHFATYPALAALAAHRLSGIPFSFTAHAHDIYVDQEMLSEKVKAAAFVVTISDYNKDFFAAHCGEGVRGKIHVVHCGVDTSLFQPRPESSKSDVFTIVCVGSLEEKKGQTYLIEACRLLQERNVKFTCHLVGEGPTGPALAHQIERAGLTEQIKLTGGLPRDKVADLVSRADVVVLPSIRTKSGMMEGIPVALMEALACEVPVVSSRLSGIPELVEDGVTGLLTRPGEPGELADALFRLYNAPELRRRMGKAGRQAVLREFDLPTNAAKLARLFQEPKGTIHEGDRAAAYTA